MKLQNLAFILFIQLLLVNKFDKMQMQKETIFKKSLSVKLLKSWSTHLGNKGWFTYSNCENDVGKIGFIAFPL